MAKAAKFSLHYKMQRIDDILREFTPQVYSYITGNDDFRGLTFKVRDDGTLLVIAKAYGDDGGELVCFAQGLDLVGCLLSLEGSLAANSWKVDKPWKPGTN